MSAPKKYARKPQSPTAVYKRICAKVVEAVLDGQSCDTALNTHARDQLLTNAHLIKQLSLNPDTFNVVKEPGPTFMQTLARQAARHPHEQVQSIIDYCARHSHRHLVCTDGLHAAVSNATGIQTTTAWINALCQDWSGKLPSGSPSKAVIAAKQAIGKMASYHRRIDHMCDVARHLSLAAPQLWESVQESILLGSLSDAKGGCFQAWLSAHHQQPLFTQLHWDAQASVMVQKNLFSHVSPPPILDIWLESFPADQRKSLVFYALGNVSVHNTVRAHVIQALDIPMLRQLLARPALTKTTTPFNPELFCLNAFNIVREKIIKKEIVVSDQDLEDMEACQKLVQKSLQKKWMMPHTFASWNLLSQAFTTHALVKATDDKGCAAARPRKM